MFNEDDKASCFLSPHQGPAPLLIPNPWDPGSAKVLAAMGFEALATTSGGFAATLGRVEGSITRDEAVARAAAIVAAVDRRSHFRSSPRPSITPTAYPTPSSASGATRRLGPTCFSLVEDTGAQGLDFDESERDDRRWGAHRK
jgi:hypothetical protein